MKKLISLIIAAVLTAFAVCSAPASAASDNQVKYETIKVTAHLYSDDDTESLTCLFRSDLPSVPYIGVTDYLSQLYEVKFSTLKNGDGTFTISDKYGSMTVDVDKDLITFDSYEDFMFNDTRPILEDETADYIQSEDEINIIGDQKSPELDLSKYGIDLTSWGDEVYFPLTTINDIFAGTYHAALYIDGEIYFADVMEDEPYYDAESMCKSVKRDKTLAEFTYNELCFVMDNFYGCPPNSPLAEDIAYKGFDRTLAEYNAATKRARTFLQSDDLVDYCYGMMFLDEYLNDGGHTVMSAGVQRGISEYPDSAFAKAFYESVYDGDDDRYMTVMRYYADEIEDENALEDLEDYKEQELKKLTEVKTWDDASFYRFGAVGLFVFEEFKDAVVDAFKWSLDYSVDNGINNFVIDLSTNGGGSTAVSVYMLSVMRDYSRSDYEDRLSENRFYYTDTVDKNLDGEFDEKDGEVSYDLNFAILTTRFSFSCANLLPCIAKDNGIPILGETSGGGTCAISLHYDPSGFMYAVSDNTMMVHEDGRDLDGGAEPDYKLPGRDDDYEGFYNIDRIKKCVNSYYASTPDTPEPTEEPTEDDTPVIVPEVDSSVVMYVWIGAISVSVIAVIIFAVILIRSSSKKKRL